MLEANISQFKIEMFVDVATALAGSVVDITPHKILPTMFESKVVTNVSETIKKYAQLN
jgi:malic enzyme